MITKFVGEYAFLSNFFGVPGGIYIIPRDGVALHVQTVEHGYQALKAARWEDCLKIAKVLDPGRAKRLGRECEIRPNWDEMRVPVMRDLLQAKFKRYPLGEHLLETGDDEIIEGNTWGDMFWGCVLIDGVWVGQNQLGKLLMEIRRELKNGDLL